MYAGIRMYRLVEGDMDDAMHRVDTDFAPMIEQEEGFVAYEAVRIDDERLCTFTLFSDRDGVLASHEMAAEFVRDKMSDMKLERESAEAGEVAVSRAQRAVLEP